MTTPSKHRANVLALALVMALVTGGAGAQSQDDGQPQKKWLNCDVDWPFSEEDVGPDFSLQISFHSTPIPSTKIELRKNGGDVVATSKTDSRGIAHFHAIPAGRYTADSADGLLFPPTNLKVDAKHASIEKATVDWPEHAIAVRSPRGRFSVSEEEKGSPALPLRGATVELRDLYSGRVIESKSTDINGDFEFATKDHGVYALRLTLLKKGEADPDYHYLAFVLDPAASEESIPEIKAVQTECNGIQVLSRSRAGGQWMEFQYPPPVQHLP
jgi:hypothetical protein